MYRRLIHVTLIGIVQMRLQNVIKTKQIKASCTRVQTEAGQT